MTTAQKLIAQFIGVFVIGAAAGAMIMWWYTDTQLVNFMSRTNNADALTARITQRYSADFHLTPEEMERIKPTIRDMALHMSQVRRQFGVDVMSGLGEYHAKIAEQLGPEHRASYASTMAVREKQLRMVLLLDEPAGTESK